MVHMQGTVAAVLADKWRPGETTVKVLTAVTCKTAATCNHTHRAGKTQVKREPPVDTAFVTRAIAVSG